MACKDRKWFVRVVDIMRWLKGVVINTSSINSVVQIELETGRRCWATPHFKLDIHENVLISWDYTNDRVNIITTKERWKHTDTERERIEARMNKIDGFQNPSDEELEGDLSDITETSSKQKPYEDEENSKCDVFQIPLGEDVDRDDVVLLRKDIQH